MSLIDQAQSEIMRIYGVVKNNLEKMQTPDQINVAEKAALVALVAATVLAILASPFGPSATFYFGGITFVGTFAGKGLYDVYHYYDMTKQVGRVKDQIINDVSNLFK